jgi:hypothetical protein
MPVTPGRASHDGYLRPSLSRFQAASLLTLAPRRFATCAAIPPRDDDVCRYQGQAAPMPEARYWLGVHCHWMFEPTTAQKMIP